MAYGNYLASVSEKQITNLAAEPTEHLNSHKMEIVSHLVAYWVKVQPLGRLLGEALDGGNVVSEALWHPLRRPKYHSPDRVIAIYGELSQAWQEAQSELSVPHIDWFRIEIEKVLAVFSDAATNDLCVVSALDAPLDAERANRVRFLFRQARE